MSIWILVLGILFFIIGAAFAAFDNAAFTQAFTFIGAWFLGCYVFRQGDFNKPQAIDVYRGKTTLEITYRDSVAIDSVVVFKNK